MTCVIDISLLQFGQLSIVGTTEDARLALMTLLFRPTECRGEQKAHPGLGACQSEKQELELARSLCDSGSITKIIVRLLSTRVEQKRKQVTTLVGCLATQQLPSHNHFVICGPKLALVLLTGKWLAHDIGQRHRAVLDDVMPLGDRVGMAHRAEGQIEPRNSYSPSPASSWPYRSGQQIMFVPGAA